MSHWKQEKKEPERFSWQAATKNQRACIVRSVKDEIHQLLEDNGEIERTLADMHWEKLTKNDELWFTYCVQVNLPVLRIAIRTAQREGKEVSAMAKAAKGKKAKPVEEKKKPGRPKKKGK